MVLISPAPLLFLSSSHRVLQRSSRTSRLAISVAWVLPRGQNKCLCYSLFQLASLQDFFQRAFRWNRHCIFPIKPDTRTPDKKKQPSKQTKKNQMGVSFPQSPDQQMGIFNSSHKGGHKFPPNQVKVPVPPEKNQMGIEPPDSTISVNLNFHPHKWCQQIPQNEGKIWVGPTKIGGVRFGYTWPSDLPNFWPRHSNFLQMLFPFPQMSLR
jgi:hypothetical protein